MVHGWCFLRFFPVSYSYDLTVSNASDAERSLMQARPATVLMPLHASFLVLGSSYDCRVGQLLWCSVSFFLISTFIVVIPTLYSPASLLLYWRQVVYLPPEPCADFNSGQCCSAWLVVSFPQPCKGLRACVCVCAVHDNLFSYFPHVYIQFAFCIWHSINIPSHDTL